jgi:hypothetical protein
MPWQKYSPNLVSNQNKVKQGLSPCFFFNLEKRTYVEKNAQAGVIRDNGKSF